MRMLFPEDTAAVDPLALYADDNRPRRGNRPWVMLNMITSVDGATDANGRSGELSNPGDKTVFAAIRAVADIILVGAETLRAESYGPPSATSAIQATRMQRKQAPRPRLAIVSGSLDLDFSGEVFADNPPPLLFTGAKPPPERLARAKQVAAVHTAKANASLGDNRVDLTEIIKRLGELGAGVVLAEGGPSLNGQIFSTGMADELCWSIAPLLAGGQSQRLSVGAPAVLQGLILDRVLTQDHTLFLRYLTVSGTGSRNSGNTST